MQRNKILIVSNDLEFYTYIQNAMQDISMDAHQSITLLGALNDFTQWPYCLIMSRLGRDYLKVGHVMGILQQRGVHLIAINDSVDSAQWRKWLYPFFEHHV